MKWATRVGCHIDRAASAWLIKRFVDSDAEFVFLDRDEPCPPGATMFDVPGAELSHQRGLCSFEVIQDRYSLAHPAIARLARLVHDADLEDERYGDPAASGVGSVFSGLALTGSDHETLALGLSIFDGLFALARRGEITDAATL